VSQPRPFPSMKPSPGAVLLKVRAQPGASSDRIVGIHGDALKVAVTAPPDRGRANAAIAEVLAEHLGVPKRCVRLHAGPTSRDKWFRLEGLTTDRLQALLSRHLEGGGQAGAAGGPSSSATFAAPQHDA